jgi:hypothetical protein
LSPIKTGRACDEFEGWMRTRWQSEAERGDLTSELRTTWSIASARRVRRGTEGAEAGDDAELVSKTTKPVDLTAVVPFMVLPCFVCDDLILRYAMPCRALSLSSSLHRRCRGDIVVGARHLKYQFAPQRRLRYSAQDHVWMAKDTPRHNRIQKCLEEDFDALR